MKVFSFKLKGIKGRDGIQADVLKPVFDKKLGITVNDRAKNYTRPIAIPTELYRKIQMLKVHFLVLMGYWREEWSELNIIGENGDLKREDMTIPGYGGLVHTWDNSYVNEVSYDSNTGSFVIGGIMKVVGDKEMQLKTVNVSEVDSGFFTDYYKCIDVLEDVIAAVATYLKDDRIHMMNPREFLLSLYSKDAVEKNRIDEQDEKTNLQEMIRQLEKKNYVVYNPEESMPALMSGDESFKENEVEKYDDQLEDEDEDDYLEKSDEAELKEEDLEYKDDDEFNKKMEDIEGEDVDSDDVEFNEDSQVNDNLDSQEEYLSEEEQEDYGKDEDFFN